MRFLLPVLLLFPAVVLAAEPAKIEAESLMPQVKAAPKEDDKPVTAEEQALMICQTAEIMGKKLDSAEYKPGVDAYGREVAPADIYESMAFAVPDEIEIPIQVDVMAAMGIPNPKPEGKATMGTLTIYKNGALLYNGKDITNTIEGYCREHMRKMEKKKQ